LASYRMRCGGRHMALILRHFDSGYLPSLTEL
jgi:hypothetical protein